MQTAIYTRVSQDSRGAGRSVAEQEGECRTWADREGWDVEGVWCDNDISASKYSKKTRPGWKALTDRLERGGIDVLVVWEPSRATRDRRVWAALAAICEEQGVRFGCNGRVYDLDDPDDAFQLDLFFALATRESGATRKRVLRSTRAAAAEGRPHGRVPYGYRRTYREGRQGPELVAQVEHEDQAPVVREVARRVMAGEALYAVAGDLNSRGVPAPRGADWEPTQIRRLCVNPTYIAKRTHKGQVVGGGQWPAILDERTHYACVGRLTDPARRSNLGRGARHLLSGLARCGTCGGPMVVQKNRGHLAYLCRQGFHVSRKQDNVDEMVERVVIARLSRPDLLQVLAADRGDDQAVQAAGEAQEKQARLEGFYDAAARGELTPTALARIEAALLPEIASAQRRARPVATSPLLQEVSGVDAEVRWAGLSLEQRREVIGILCEVRIDPAGRGHRVFDPRGIDISWRTAS